MALWAQPDKAVTRINTPHIDNQVANDVRKTI